MAASVGPGGANLARKASLAKESGHKIGGSSCVVTCDWIHFADGTLFVSGSDFFLYMGDSWSLLISIEWCCGVF